MLGDIIVETTIDLEDYRDDVLEAMQPDDIEDAMHYLEEWWGFTDVDVLGCLLQDMDSDLLIEKLSQCLDVSSALTLVERLHEYTISFSKQRENTKDNHIKDLKDRVDNLLAVCNPSVIKEAEELHNDV
jgi:hypothetical protein